MLGFHPFIAAKSLEERDPWEFRVPYLPYLTIPYHTLPLLYLSPNPGRNDSCYEYLCIDIIAIQTQMESIMNKEGKVVVSNGKVLHTV